MNETKQFNHDYLTIADIKELSEHQSGSCLRAVAPDRLSGMPFWRLHSDSKRRFPRVGRSAYDHSQGYPSADADGVKGRRMIKRAMVTAVSVACQMANGVDKLWMDTSRMANATL